MAPRCIFLFRPSPWAPESYSQRELWPELGGLGGCLLLQGLSPGSWQVICVPIQTVRPYIGRLPLILVHAGSLSMTVSWPMGGVSIFITLIPSEISGIECVQPCSNPSLILFLPSSSKSVLSPLCLRDNLVKSSSSFYRYGNQDTERGGDLHKAMDGISATARSWKRSSDPKAYIFGLWIIRPKASVY